MSVYPVTQVDRDLFLFGGDLEALLADRERERLERDGRTQARQTAGAIARLGHHAPERGEDHYARSRPVSA